MPANRDTLKAKIIDKNDLKKSSAERQAESLLRRLTSKKAIEVDLDSASSRTVRRTFSKAAANLGITIQLRTRDDKVFVLLKEGKPQNRQRRGSAEASHEAVLALEKVEDTG